MFQHSKIGQRLKMLRKKHSFSQQFIAEKLSISQAAYSLMENSHNGINSEHITRLSELYHVTTDFLLKGNKNLISMDSKNGFLPFINTKAHAGFFKKSHDHDVMDDFEFYRIPGYNPSKESVLIEIEGDSMQPTVMSGDILICQRQKKLDFVLDGSLAIISTKQDLLTKRLYKHENSEYFWMESDNPDEERRKQIRKSNILKLFMVHGKVSTALIPHKELAFKGKIKAMEDAIKALNIEVYDMSKLLQAIRTKK